MKLSIIVAMAKNRVIGNKGQLPWHLSADLQYFKRVTLGKPVIMGRKTWDSIGKPLPGRKNIVISRDRALAIQGCMVHSSIDAALDVYRQSDAEVMIIGGATLYRELLVSVDRLYITQVHAEPTGDTYFPSVDESQWTQVASEKGYKDEHNDYDYCFKTWDRNVL